MSITKGIIYNKLVRDKIPQIIFDSGKIPVCNTLSDEDYEKCLQDKLYEEIAEYKESKNAEELADILEVIYALGQVHCVSPAELEKIRIEKAASRGAFHQKIFLQQVLDSEKQ